jgi:NAD(P)-dependent dehydrogenase (short-subunit alcohol dehydrogenase family)
MAGTDRPQGVAVVTGAAGGMGSATAREFVDEGWKELLLCDISAERLEAVAAPLREQGAKVDILAGDIADPDYGSQLIAALNGRPIAALVHTAGLSPQMAGPERILLVNLDASVRLVEAIREHMAPGSAAVLYASNSAHMPMPPEAAAAFWAPLPEGGALALAHLCPTPEMAYPMSKIGVRALVKREAKSFGLRGARLVSVSPGAIDTAMTQGEAAASPIVGKMINDSAVGRIGRPEELAAVSVFLCSPKASYVSATDWLVDGGQIAGMGF